MNVETAMKLMRRAKNVDTGLRIEKGDLQNEDHEGRPEETKHHNEQRREKGMRQNKRGSVK